MSLADFYSHKFTELYYLEGLAHEAQESVYLFKSFTFSIIVSIHFEHDKTIYASESIHAEDRRFLIPN